MEMEPRDTIVWRILGAIIVSWIGVGIGSACAPEFGSEAYLSIVAAQNAMVGAFCGALFGGGIGWLIDRAVGNGRRSKHSHRHEQIHHHEQIPNQAEIDKLEQIHQQRIRENRNTDDEPNWHYGG